MSPWDGQKWDRFSSTLAERVDMLSVRIVCLKGWPTWDVGTAAGDAVYLSHEKDNYFLLIDSLDRLMTSRWSL